MPFSKLSGEDFPVGLEQQLRNVRCHLAEPQVGIIGICGMPGIGKSTFLQKLYRDLCDEEDNGFDAVILATAGGTTVFFVQCCIARQKYLNKELETIKEAFVRLNPHPKKCLLILDNVREPLSIKKHGFPDPRAAEHRCKIVLASRLRRVCRDMRADRVFHVAPLREAAALELFQKHSGSVLQHPEITQIARDIVRECGGLPRSLVAVGRAMAGMRLPLEWNKQLELIIETTAVDPKPNQGAELSVLESRFEGLASDRLRACLLYCSALLEGPSVPIHDVIEHWLEQGIFGDFLGNMVELTDAYKEGVKIIQQLEDAGLLLKRSSSASGTVITFQSHVQSFALCKIKQQFLEKAGYRENSVGASSLFPSFEISFQALDDEVVRNCFLYFSLFPGNMRDLISTKLIFRYWRAEGFWRTSSELHHISDVLSAEGLTFWHLQRDAPNMLVPELHSYIISKAQKRGFLAEAGRGLSEAPAEEKWKDVQRASLMHNHIKSLEIPRSITDSLKTLILKGNILLKSISHNVFMSTSLRILDLSSTGITYIPRDIGNMAALIHLDLSFTKIKSLPEEVGRLRKLEYLGLESTILLEHVPANVFSRLSSLVELNMYDSFSEWVTTKKGKQLNSQESSRASLEELECLESLSAIGITLSNSTAYEQYQNSNRLMEAVEHLVLKNCEHVQISSKFFCVKNLTISDCFGLEELVIDCMNTDELPDYPHSFRMDVWRLVGLYKAQIVWKGVQQGAICGRLRELTIGFCHELVDLSWLSGIRWLQLINIYSCKNLEHVINNVETRRSIDAFRHLENLRLRKLPSLTSICPYDLELPVLRHLKVLECPQLRKLPIETFVNREDAQGEKIQLSITGTRVWWEDLQWMHPRTKQILDENFQDD